MTWTNTNNDAAHARGSHAGAPLTETPHFDPTETGTAKLAEWSELRAALHDAFPDAVDDAGALRLQVDGVPVTVWLGVSGMRHGGKVVHAAAPIIKSILAAGTPEPGSLDANAAAPGAATTTATETNTAAKTDATRETGTAENAAKPGAQAAHPHASRLLEKLGIDPEGPDLVQIVRLAENLPLGGVRLLGNRPHLHFSVRFPVSAHWLAAAIRLLVTQTKAISKEALES
ncbi:hypothetical protein ACU19_05050 [Actinobaculum suis]|uniref:hypothetical protein n=1 Tax=Actinobaculum suis TaxID=1657 RepID=UPI00066FD098|nr:hypothetical protein [Actinobaculum suis]KMY23338.1 hypothetical protein ACU19_05050 [Actinobaculum suis]